MHRRERARENDHNSNRSNALVARLPVAVSLVYLPAWALRGKTMKDMGMTAMQGHEAIPWAVHLRIYEQYAKSHGTSQSAIRIAERGGFSVSEADWLYPAWRNECEELPMLRLRVKELEGSAQLADGRYTASIAALRAIEKDLMSFWNREHNAGPDDRMGDGSPGVIDACMAIVLRHYDPARPEVSMKDLKPLEKGKDDE